MRLQGPFSFKLPTGNKWRHNITYPRSHSCVWLQNQNSLHLYPYFQSLSHFRLKVVKIFWQNLSTSLLSQTQIKVPILNVNSLVRYGFHGLAISNIFIRTPEVKRTAWHLGILIRSVTNKHSWLFAKPNNPQSGIQERIIILNFRKERTLPDLGTQITHAPLFYLGRCRT